MQLIVIKLDINLIAINSQFFNFRNKILYHNKQIQANNIGINI